jgi:hypothetical protein
MTRRDDEHVTPDSATPDSIPDVTLDEEHALSVAEEIDRAVDGTLDDQAMAAFEARLEESVAIREAYEDAVAVRGTLISKRAEPCPDVVVDAIWARVATLPSSDDAESPATAEPRRRSTWWSMGLPIFGAGVAVLLAVWGISSVYSPALLSPDRSTDPVVPVVADGTDLEGYTDEELMAAVHDARVALSILAGAMNKSTARVGQELRHSLTYPVTRGLQETMEHVPPPFVSPSGEAGRG